MRIVKERDREKSWLIAYYNDDSGDDDIGDNGDDDQ